MSTILLNFIHGYTQRCDSPNGSSYLVYLNEFETGAICTHLSEEYIRPSCLEKYSTLKIHSSLKSTSPSKGIGATRRVVDTMALRMIKRKLRRDARRQLDMTGLQEGLSPRALRSWPRYPCQRSRAAGKIYPEKPLAKADARALRSSIKNGASLFLYSSSRHWEENQFLRASKQ